MKEEGNTNMEPLIAPSAWGGEQRRGGWTEDSKEAEAALAMILMSPGLADTKDSALARSGI